MTPARRIRPAAIATIGALTSLLITAIPGLTAPGELDPTFDDDGRVITRIAGFAEIQDLAIQPDGKIVAAGYAHGAPYRFALARYNADGSPDLQFGSLGQLTTDFGSFSDGAWAVAIGPDGKIAAAGWTDTAAGLTFAVARFNTDGSLDGTFGTEGKVFTDFGGLRGQAQAVAIQKDGKILAAGYAGRVYGDFALVRYGTDGSLDDTFGGDGTVLTDFFSDDSDMIFALTILGDGRILAAGSADTGGPRGPDFALAAPVML
jgi:uncharacterized delta-60 repeat protein